MTHEEIHKALVDTRNIIATRGHAKYDLEDDDGRVCLLGGLNLALTGDSSRSPFGITQFAKKLRFDSLLAAVDWNNAPERTPEEVLARLDKAILETAPAPAGFEPTIDGGEADAAQNLVHI